MFKSNAKAFLIAILLTCSIVSPTTFASPSGVAIANQANAGQGQPNWIVAWVIWATRGAIG